MYASIRESRDRTIARLLTCASQEAVIVAPLLLNRSTPSVNYGIIILTTIKKKNLATIFLLPGFNVIRFWESLFPLYEPLT